jgi:hypothetical protein
MDEHNRLADSPDFVLEFDVIVVGVALQGLIDKRKWEWSSTLTVREGR